MPLPSYEKLGVFYLGREYDPATQQLGDDLLYDSRDLTTHAVCIGMTGSGKTGLCVSLLEEAAIDGIPAIVIDPKGDIANLALTFPQLRPEDFKPWVDAGEASRKGQSVDEFAAATAATWRKGLEDWGQDGERIQRLRDAAVVDIYTPGSNAGRPLSILRSFAAPDPVVANDATALKERVGSAVAGLLGLLGIDADPIRSREFILLSALLDAAWRKGESLDLAALIRSVQKPPFDKVGVFDVDSFFPAKDRTELALRINGLLASPGFEAWLAGDALDIQSLLYDANGKPRIAIISIAHLNDAERMFVVTLVTNELVAWMRRQSGTTSLRAIFYMDEVFGFFPPSAMPPSKTADADADEAGARVRPRRRAGDAESRRPRLQGPGQRRHLVHRPPADGARQGARDRRPARQRFGRWHGQVAARSGDVEPAAAHVPDAQRARRSARAAAHALGTFVPARSADLGRDREAGRVGGESSPPRLHPPQRPGPLAAATSRAPATASGSRPIVPAGVPEKFMAAAGNQGVEYEPRIGARVRAHFVDAKAGLDAWENWYYLAPLTAQGPDWDAAEICNADAIQLLDAPAADATFADVAGSAIAAKAFAQHGKSLADHVYRTSSLSILRCPDLKLTSAPGGSESEFRARLALAVREKRDAAVDALRRKYASKLDTIEDRARKAEQKLVREKEQSSQQTMSSALSVGGSLLGALFGGRRGSAFGKASSAARSVGRIGKERTDVAHAAADLTALQQQHAALEAELADEIAALESKFDAGAIAVEQSEIKARKSDTEVTDLALVWQPA